MSGEELFRRAYMNIVYWKNKDGTDKEEPVVWPVKNGGMSITDSEEKGAYIDIMTTDENQFSFLLLPHSIGILLRPKDKEDPIHLATIFTDGTMIADGLSSYKQPNGKTMIEPNDDEE